LEFSKAVFLVTGGAGSLGSAVVKHLLSYNHLHAVRVFDSNEDALFKLKRELDSPKLRTLLGDIRDRERVKMALEGVDCVIHCAAVKNLEVSEYNAPETTRVNIEGTNNLIETFIRTKGKVFVFVSSDKAVEYESIYGATKFVGEKLTTWASRVTSEDKQFVVIRTGNFFESRGNVFEVWAKEMKANKPISITDPTITRYFIHIDEAASFVVSVVKNPRNGAIYVPKMQNYKIMDLAKKTGAEFKVIGLRDGEKMMEELMTEKEKLMAEETDDRWIIPREKSAL